MTSITRRGLGGLAGTFAIGLRHACADTLSDVRARGKITVGCGLMGLRPYVWRGADGRYEGFEPDMIRYVIGRLGIADFEYVTTDWTSLVPGLKARRYDIIWSALAKKQERIQGANLAMSHPYFVLVGHIQVMGDSPIRTVADLRGKVVASTLGTTESMIAHAMKARGEIGEVRDFNDFGSPYVAMRNRQVDALLMDQATLAGMSAQLPGIRIVGEPLTYIAKPEWQAAEETADYRLGSLAVCMRPDDTTLMAAFDDAIRAMYADGTHRRILERHGIWTDSQANPMKPRPGAA